MPVMAIGCCVCVMEILGAGCCSMAGWVYVATILRVSEFDLRSGVMGVWW